MAKYKPAWAGMDMSTPCNIMESLDDGATWRNISGAEAMAVLNSIEEKDAKIERLKAELDQIMQEAVVKEENMEQAVRNIARLKAELAALQNEHSDACFLPGIECPRCHAKLMHTRIHGYRCPRGCK